MTDAYFPWMDTIKAKVVAAHATGATALSLPNNGEVYGYNEWPGNLPGWASLIGIKETIQTYGMGSPCENFYEVGIWMFHSALTMADAQAMLAPFIIIMRNQFASSLTLDGTVEDISPSEKTPISGPGMAQYGGSEYPALIFTYTVKVNDSGDFTVGV